MYKKGRRPENKKGECMTKNVGKSNIIKFILGTLFGVFFVLVPFNFDGKVDTVLFYYVKLFVSKFNNILTPLVVLCICASALISLFNLFNNRTYFANDRLMKKLFVTSPFYVVNRIIGAILALMIYFKVGPDFIISEDTGGSMLSLATQLSVVVPSMLLFQTFILEFGAMEFLGQFVGKIVKPLFKVSEICATSIISAWVGPGNAAIMGTSELFDQGYYTLREAAIISTQFTTGSIGWVVVVSSVLGVMDYFGSILLGLFVVSIIVAFISVRIKPVSSYADVYSESNKATRIKNDTAKQGSVIARATEEASNRASQVTSKNFISKIDNMTFFIFWLTPIIVFWGTAALILATHTPVISYVSLPIEWILSFMGVEESKVAASAIMSGIADNYLPVIIGESIQSVQTRVIVAMMSIISIIYLSETATLLTSTKMVPRFIDVIIIFLERTFIALPFVVLFVKLIA